MQINFTTTGASEPKHCEQALANVVLPPDMVAVTQNQLGRRSELLQSSTHSVEQKLTSIRTAVPISQWQEEIKALSMLDVSFGRPVSGLGLYRVVIVDDYQPAHSIFKCIIELAGKFEVVGTSTNTKQLLASVKEWQPDLILMDNRLNDEIDGVMATRLVLEEYPKAAVMMYSSYPDGQRSGPELIKLIKAAQQAGVINYFFREENNHVTRLTEMMEASINQIDLLTHRLKDLEEALI